MTALAELADRCEQATGPDRELDVAIFGAIGAPVPFQFFNKLVALTFDEAEQCYFAPIGDMRVRYTPPAYTASLDAAMTLATEDLSFWFILQEAAKRCALANEANTEAEFRKRLPAFVCAAALRARSA